MVNDFEAFLSVRLNENQAPLAQPQSKFGGLFRAIAQSIRAHAHTNPLFSFLMENPKEFEEFLMSAHYVLKAMHPEEREMVASGPQGMAMLLQRMVADYESRSPELKASDMQKQYNDRWGVGKKQVGPGQTLHPAHTPSGRKLLELIVAAHPGGNWKPVADQLVGVMAKNGQAKVDQWAKQINTPQEMMAKINDWKTRGIL